MSMVRGLALAGMILSAGCALTPPPVTAARPAWMETPHQKYPVARYLTAVGEGDTLQAAESVALGNLAKIFRSEVTVDERLTERYYELTGKQNLYQEQTQMDRDVTVRSDLRLLNVQYPERYTDPRTGRVFVLAALHRADTAAIYVSRLNENEDLIARWVARGDETPSPALRFAVLSAAAAVSADSRLLSEQLEVLLPAARDRVSRRYSHDQITERLSAAARAIGFSVQIEDDPQGKIAAAVVAMLTGAGFTVSPENAFLRAHGRVSLERTDLGRQGLSFIRYAVQIEIMDAGGNTVAALSERGREGHVSETEAVSRCLRTMETAIGRRLYDRLMGYFDRLAMQ